MKLRTIPLGIVGIDNNSMKSYIAMMAKYGLQPRTIVYLRNRPAGRLYYLLKTFLGEGVERE